MNLRTFVQEGDAYFARELSDMLCPRVAIQFDMKSLSSLLLIISLQLALCGPAMNFSFNAFPYQITC